MRNNKRELVSIIMPAFHAEQTIGESIQSVISQTYSNWELIVVDDGSKDQTCQIAASYDDKRIRIIQKENSGVADTRNIGIKESKGKYVAFLDSDDIWLSQKLEIQIAMFRNSAQNLGLVHSAYTEFKDSMDNQSYPKIHTPVKKRSGFVFDELAVTDFIGTLTVVVKRSVFDDVGLFDTQLSGPEDWDLWIRISKKYSIGYIGKPLAKYRLNPKGISKKIDMFEKELWKVLEKHLLSSNLSVAKKKKGLWLYHRHMTHAWTRNRVYKKAFQHLVRVLITGPFRLSNINSVLFLIVGLVESMLKRNRRQTIIT